MAVKIGDTVEFIADVTSPAPQAGTVGDKKVVGKDIDLGSAKRLLRGPDVALKIVPAATKPKPAPAPKSGPKTEE